MSLIDEYLPTLNSVYLFDYLLEVQFNMFEEYARWDRLALDIGK